MKKRKPALFAICALAVVLGGTAYFIRDIPPTIPPFDEALFIKIGARDSGAIKINDEELDQLRQIFEAANRDRNPMKWSTSGVLELRNHGTKVSTIQIFSNPKGPGPFEIRDVYYLGYDRESLQKILKRSKPTETP